MDTDKYTECSICEETFKRVDLEGVNGASGLFCGECLTEAVEEFENYQEHLSYQD